MFYNRRRDEHELEPGMSVDLWGFDGGISFGLPARPLGFGLILLYAILLVILFVRDFRSKPSTSRQSTGSGEWAWLALLVVTAALSAGTFLFYLPTTGLPVSPGVPRLAPAPYFAVFAAVPWLLAAGTLGLWQAILVGLAGGLAAGLAETSSPLTPLSYGLTAAVAAFCLRNTYREWPGKVLRSPAVTGLVTGLCLGFLLGLEQLAYTGGSLLDGLGFAAAQVRGLLLAGMAQGLVAGLIAEGFRLTIPELWFRPKALQSGPLSRSLAAQTVAAFGMAGVVIAAAMLYGDWLLARSAARQMVGAQLNQTGQLAADSIPYVIQTGRSFSRQIAEAIAPALLDEKMEPEDLDTWSRLLPYFDQLAVVDNQGEVTVQSTGAKLDPRLLAQIQPELTIARLGAPEEAILGPGGGSRGSRLVLVTPILDPEAEAPIATLIGWTDLSRNPLLMPVLGHLASVEPGEAFVTDEDGTIVLHPDPTRLMDRFDLAQQEPDSVVSVSSSDGTRSLQTVTAVRGYPWRVVVRSPQTTVDVLAARIVGQLVLVIAAVGGITLLAVYLIGRRLTRPLRDMTGAVETIAQGDLSQPLSVTRQDEAGALAESMERMRRGLESRLSEMDILLKLSQQLAVTFDLSVVMPQVLGPTRQLVDADLARLVVADSGSSRETPLAFQSGSDPGGWSILDPQIAGLCRERGAFILDNPSRARGLLRMEAVGVPIAGLMAAPMRNEGRFIGALWLAFRDPHSVSQDELRLVAIIASQLAVSVANARLFQQAEEERLRLSAVLETTPDAVIVTDRSGRILLANPASEVVLRGPANACIGLPATEWVEPAELLAAMLDAGPEAHTLELSLAGGRALFGSVLTVEDPSDARFHGRVCVLWDVTQFKKLDMLKSEFVATVSHDLRAPLTLMNGYTTMLPMVGSLNEQQKEFVTKISESVAQMTQLVDNLLDLGRIEAGVGLSLAPIEPAALVSDVLHAYQGQAAAKRLSLVPDVEVSQRRVQADPVLLRQALGNLVDNAVRFAPAGSRVVVRGWQAEGQQHFTVADSGAGIAPADQARLFEKFFRTPRADSRRQRGTGLGLAIVKSIAEQHGGRVSVESQLGAGSVFGLHIPLDLGSSGLIP
jgi:signal transduction histidine kinase/HAMP domain-containing protein